MGVKGPGCSTAFSVLPAVATVVQVQKSACEPKKCACAPMMRRDLATMSSSASGMPLTIFLEGESCHVD